MHTYKFGLNTTKILPKACQKPIEILKFVVYIVLYSFLKHRNACSWKRKSQAENHILKIKVYSFAKLIILQSNIFFHSHELKLLSLFIFSSSLLSPVVCIYPSPFFHIYYYCVPARRLGAPCAHFPPSSSTLCLRSSPAHRASFITSSHYPLSY